MRYVGVDISSSEQAFVISGCLNATLLFSLRDRLRSDIPIAPENCACVPYFSVMPPGACCNHTPFPVPPFSLCKSSKLLNCR